MGVIFWKKTVILGDLTTRYDVIGESKNIENFWRFQKNIKTFLVAFLWLFCKEIRNRSVFLKTIVILVALTTHYDVIRESKKMKIFEDFKKILKKFFVKFLWPFCQELRNGSIFFEKVVIFGTLTPLYDVIREFKKIENFLKIKKKIKKVFS